jgi:hypothetical protein
MISLATSLARDQHAVPNWRPPMVAATGVHDGRGSTLAVAPGDHCASGCRVRWKLRRLR